jgi:hypothetical protein
MPQVTQAEKPTVMTALPSFFFVVALMLLMYGLIAEVPHEIVDALYLTAAFAFVLGICLYGQAGIKAVRS